MIGHPIHPALVHFPIVCWTLTTLADLLVWFFAMDLDQVAGILLLTGLVTALGAMLAGLLDWERIQRHPAAKPYALWHMALVSSSLLFYGLSLWMRTARDQWLDLGIPALSFSLLGFFCLCVGAWCGANLVYRYGIGVQTQDQ